MRTSRRNFPDAGQLAIAAPTILNQSQLTFSGQPGLVIILTKVTVRNTLAGAVPQARVQWLTTAPVVSAPLEYRDIGAGVGTLSTFFTFAVLRDPPEGSIIRLELDPGTGTLDVLASNGAIVALSFPKEVDQGPVVTVQ